MDWYDRQPYDETANADSEGVAREYGRIWRVVYVGEKQSKPVPSRPEKNMNLARLSSALLVQMLAHPNVWQRRTAQRLLNERRDPKTKAPLEKLLADGTTIEARLAALWTLHGSELLDDATLDKYTNDKKASVRAWATRLTGERGADSPAAIQRLAAPAIDRDPRVRLSVATRARQF